MFKKVLALTLAAVMLLMPMTASAVTWNQIVQSGYNYVSVDDNVKVSTAEDGAVIVESNDPEKAKGYITMGYIWDEEEETYIESVITDEGVYAFRNINIGTLWAKVIDGKSIEIQIDEDAASNTGVFYIWDDGKLEVKNDGEIRYGIEMGIYEEGSSFTLTGEGNVNGKEWEDGTVKYPIIVHMRASEEDGKSAEQVVKEYMEQHISIDYSNITPLELEQTVYAYLDIYGSDWSEDEDTSFVLQIICDEQGNIVLVDEQGNVVFEIVKDEDDDEEEEPEPEPDPIELQRQAEGIGGVTTSPVWNWQGYLGHSSKPMWIYVNGEKVLMRQRLFWLGDSTKNHTCRINVAEPDPASIELRVGLDMLRTAQRAEISVISILDKDSNPIAQFAVSDLLGAFEQYGLEEGELLCVSADPDAEVMKVTLDGEYLPLEEVEEENAAA